MDIYAHFQRVDWSVYRLPIAKWECGGIFSFKFLSITNLTLGTWHSLSKANSGKQKLRNNRKFPHSNLLYRQSGIHSPCSTIKSAHLNPTILNKFPHRRFIMQKSLQANLFIAKVWNTRIVSIQLLLFLFHLIVSYFYNSIRNITVNILNTNIFEPQDLWMDFVCVWLWWIEPGVEWSMNTEKLW